MPGQDTMGEANRIIVEMECQDWVERISRIHLEEEGKIHKPVLLLSGLARLAAEQRRLALFGRYEAVAFRLLKRYGDATTPSVVALPYWHLRNDGLWEVLGPDGVMWSDTEPNTLTRIKGKTRPRMPELRRSKGGLPQELFDLLRSDANCFQQCVLAASLLMPEDHRASILEDLKLRIPLPAERSLPQARQSQLERIGELTSIPLSRIPPLSAAAADRIIADLQAGREVDLTDQSGGPVKLTGTLERQPIPAIPATPDQVSEIQRLSGIDPPSHFGETEARTLIEGLTNDTPTRSRDIVFHPIERSRRKLSPAQRFQIGRFAQDLNIELTEQEADEALASLMNGDSWLSASGRRHLDPLPSEGRPSAPLQVEALRRLTDRRFSEDELTAHEADRAINELVTNGFTNIHLVDGTVENLEDQRRPGEGSKMPDHKYGMIGQDSENTPPERTGTVWDDYTCRKCSRRFSGPLSNYICATCLRKENVAQSISESGRRPEAPTASIAENARGKTPDGGWWIAFEIPRMTMRRGVSLHIEPPYMDASEFHLLSPLGGQVASGRLSNRTLTVEPILPIAAGPTLILAFHDDMDDGLLATGPRSIREIYQSGQGASPLLVVARTRHDSRDLETNRHDMTQIVDIVSPYVEWRSEEHLVDPDTLTLRDLEMVLIEIIGVEQPVTGRRVLECYRVGLQVARLSPAQKGAINRALHYLVRQGSVRGEAGFAHAPMLTMAFSLPGSSPVVPRSLGPRRIRDVPPSELCAIAEEVLQRSNPQDISEAVINTIGGHPNAESLRYAAKCLDEWTS